MSLHPGSPAADPGQTAAKARAAFPWGDLSMRLRNELVTVFTDAQFTASFSGCGRPAKASWRLALVTVLRFAETLLLDTLLALCRERRLLVARGRQRTESKHVPGAVRGLNRLGCVTGTLRAALDARAVAAPEWLWAHAEER